MTTLRNVLELVDRSTPTLVRVEHQAVRTDAALASAGHSADTVGSRQQTQQLGAYERGMASVRGESSALGREMRQLGRGVHGTDRDLVSMRGTLKGVAGGMGDVGKAFGLLRLPFMAAGFTQAGAAAVSLGGGLIGMASNASAASGAIVPLVAGIGGLKLMMATAKFATEGMSDAIAGQSGALEKLHPQAREFVKDVRDMKGAIGTLRQEAQRGLLPGLDDALQRSRRALPTARRIMRQTGQRAGETASSVTTTLTTDRALRDTAKATDVATLAAGRGARAGALLATAFTSVVAGSDGLSDSLGREVLAGAKYVQHAARVAEETGRMGAFFDTTGRRLDRLTDIGGNYAKVLWEVGKAASPLGDELTGDLQRSADRTAQWASSANGQYSIRSYFNGLYPTIKETVGLAGDLTKAVGRLTSDPRSAQFVHTLRDAVPPLEDLLTHFRDEFSGPLGDGIVQASRLADNLSDTVGPFSTIAHLTLEIVGGFNDLVDEAPIVGKAVSTALSLALLGRFLGRLRSVRSEMGAVGQAAAAAGVGGTTPAIGFQLGGGTGGSSRGPTSSAGGGPSLGLPFGFGASSRGAGATTAGARGGRLSRLLGRFGGRTATSVAPEMTGPTIGFGATLARPAAGAATAAAEGSLLSGGAKGAALLARGAGKALWPVAIGMSLMDFLSTQGSIMDRTKGALNGALLGIPGMVAPDAFKSSAQRAQEAREARGERTGRAQSRVSQLAAQGPDAVIRAAQQTRADLAATRTVQTANGQVLTSSTVDLLRGQGQGRLIDGSKTVQAATGARRLQLLANQQALRPMEVQARQAQGAAAGTDALQAFSIRQQHGGLVSARRGLMADVRDEIKTNGPAARTAMAAQITPLIAELEKGGTKSQKTARVMTRQIEKAFEDAGQTVRVVNGQILTGSRSEWSQIADAMGTRAEQARQEVTKAMTDMQREAIASLTAMGFDPGFARQTVSAAETVTKASGGKLSGQAAIDAGRGAAAAGSRGAAQAAAYAKRSAKKAKGGRVPGQGTQDTVPMVNAPGGAVKAIVAPGELLVANRHSEATADRFLGIFGTSLGHIVANETRPHSAPPDQLALGGQVAGRAGSAAATGRSSRRTRGSSAAAGAGLGHPELHAGVAQAAAKVLSRFPDLQITSTTGGGHAVGSYHYKGEAVDLGGTTEAMDQAAAWIKTSLGQALTEGIHNPNLSIKNGQGVPSSFWGPAVWAEHANHIHLAVAGALRSLGGIGGSTNGSTGLAGGAIAQIPAIKAASSSVGGALGSMSTQARAAMAAGLTQRINEQLATSGASAGGADGPGGAAAPAQVRRWVIAGLRLAGIPTTPANVAAQIRLTMGESGGNPTIRQQIHDVNSTNGSGGAIGFAQMLQSTFDAYKLAGHGNILNPVDNTAASARYQMAKYHHLVGHPGYAMGGRVGSGPATMQAPDFGGWFADQGTITANRPTIIGLGDGGRSETATITHGAPRNGPLIGTLHVHHSKSGDTYKTIVAEVDRALERVGATMDAGQESELLA